MFGKKNHFFIIVATKWRVNIRVGWENNNTSNPAFTYTFNMIDYVNSLLINRYQNGNVLLLKQTHKTSNWLLDLAVVKGSTVYFRFGC